MKNIRIIILTLVLTTTFFSCMIEEEEMKISACSCDTIIYDETGYVILNISSAVETPITGHCSDLASKVIDTKTGYTTKRTCL